VGSKRYLHITMLRRKNGIWAQAHMARSTSAILKKWSRQEFINLLWRQ